jgi:predicted ATPase
MNTNSLLNALEEHSSYARLRHLSASFSPLIGREQELQEIRSLLMRPVVRLVTILGTGGVGKTRIGIQATLEAQEAFPDGVCFVPLSTLDAADFVPSAILQAMGLRTTGKRSPLEQLQALLHSKRFLLILDNFEHLVSAAPMLVTILQACADVKLLVTSRVALHIQGEFEFFLPPLALPDLKHLPSSEALSHIDAVALFVRQAQMAQQNFQVTKANANIIAKLCTYVDGLPLALELVAEQLKHQSLQAILAQLAHQPLLGADEIPPVLRQTLSNVISWSYSLLPAAAQTLFRRLSVFVGPSSLEMIEGFCQALDAGTTEVSILNDLAILVDHSLLQRVDQEGDEPAFQMLTTIRAYGRECLLQCGEMEQAQQALATYYRTFIERADQLPGTPQTHKAPHAQPSINSHPGQAVAGLLTAREVEILRLLAKGLTNKQLAKQLVISAHTVNIHVQSLYRKLNVSSRSAATRYAIEHDFI